LIYRYYKLYKRSIKKEVISSPSQDRFIIPEDKALPEIDFDLKPKYKRRARRIKSSEMREKKFLVVSKEEIIRWAQRYDEDHTWWVLTEKEIGDKIRQDNEFGMKTLREIVHWKFLTLPGREKRINNLLDEHTDEQVHRISRRALSQREDALRIEELCELKGIGVALASTVLSFYNPQSYCVYDIHVMREMYGQEPRYMFTGYNHYLQLLKDIRKMSKSYNISVREIEKALFKKNLDEN
jgi:hypothetical protein